MRSLVPFRPRVPESEWIGGRYTFPAKVREGDAVIQPEVILWLELPSGLIVGSSIIDPGKPVSLGESLEETMRQPAEGPPRKPTRIRVADARLAEELHKAAGSIPVVVAPVPELDDVYADFREAMPEEEPSYLADGEIAPAIVAELFSAARLLYRAAPWQHMHDQQVLRVDIPAFDIGGACLSVIGAAGESFGLLLFRSIDDFHSFVEAAERLERAEPPAPDKNPAPALLSLSFNHRKDLPPSMQNEIELHRWPVAGAKAYPAVLAAGGNMTALPVTERHFRILTACTRAFLTFFEHSRSFFQEEYAQPVAERITGSDGVTVSLTAPYLEVTAFDPESAASPVIASAAPALGRNSPCHCGSGRKYKNCHYASDRARTGLPATKTVHDMDSRLVQTISRFASSRYGPGWLGRISDREDYLQLFIPWVAWTAIVEEKRIADSYLEQHEGDLSADEREWFGAQKRAWLSIWEVTSVQPGVVDVRDLLTGQSRSVREEMGSRVVVARDTLLARMIDFRGLSLFGGMFGRPLPPSEAFEVVDAVRSKLRVRKGDIGIERLQDPAIGRFVMDRWSDAVDAFGKRRSIPPKLQNTDGDPLLLVTESFRFEAAARSEIEKRLAAMDEIDNAQIDPKESEFVFARGGNKMHKSWENTIVGRVMVTDETLSIETNSENRAAALGRRVRDACAGLLRDPKREVKSPSSMAKAAQSVAKKSEGMTPEEEAMLREVKEGHYRDWADTPLPILGGKTPRAAARTAKSRQQLDLLLRDMENSESRAPERARFDVRILRRELGLDEGT
ncbi:MAG: SEC-C domain-containing protein [Acidobacteriota bacterium]|nr:SEC-C domain-containing protein [Acidobacteriota bacterium]